MKSPEQQPRDRLLKILREKKDHSYGVLGLFASLAPQIKSEFHQSSDPSFFDYEEISNRVKIGKIRQSGSDIFPDTESEIEKQFFYLQYDLRKSNIRKILEHELHPNDVILELGSGTLDEGGLSFLSSSVRRELASQFSYCDINQSIIDQNLRVAPQANFKKADITSLSYFYPRESVDVILGLNIFDTLSEKDLYKALKECFTVLKRGGRLIHLMNIEPYIHAFYRNTTHDDLISLPLIINGSNRKVVTLSKSEYQEEVKNLLIMNHLEEESILLDYLASLSAKQQERLWTGLLHSNQLSEINGLALKMEPFGGVLDPFDTYCALLKGALLEAGFKKIEEDEEESSRNIDASQLPALNRKKVTSGPKGIEITPETNLENQSLLIVIETHAITAVSPSQRQHQSSHNLQHQ